MAVLYGGRVAARYAKHHLPNYGVFDEFRIFVPGHDLTVVRVRGVDVALAICEDLWQDGGPVATAREAGAELLVVVNGSPYERDKDDTRLACAPAARRGRLPLAYVNLVGGQDELVFDGDSLVVDAAGDVLARGAAVREDLLVVDLDLADAPRSTPPAPRPTASCTSTVSDRAVAPYPRCRPPHAPPLDDRSARCSGAVTGLGDYVRKNGFRLGRARLVRRDRLRAGRGLAADAIGRDERRRCRDARAPTPAHTAATTPPSSPGGLGLRLPRRPDRADGRGVPRRARR